MLFKGENTAIDWKWQVVSSAPQASGLHRSSISCRCRNEVRGARTPAASRGASNDLCWCNLPSSTLLSLRDPSGTGIWNCLRIPEVVEIVLPGWPGGYCLRVPPCTRGHKRLSIF